MEFNTRTQKIIQAALALNNQSNQNNEHGSFPYSQEDFDDMPVFIESVDKPTNVGCFTVESHCHYQNENVTSDNITYDSLVAQHDEMGDNAFCAISSADVNVFCNNEISSSQHILILENSSQLLQETGDEIIHTLTHNLEDTVNKKGNEVSFSNRVPSSEIKLVDYDLSSESDDTHANSDKDRTIATSTNKEDNSKANGHKRIIFGKRFDSEISYSSVKTNEDSDFFPNSHSEISGDESDGLAGNRSMRKKRNESKKKIRKLETNLGKGKSVKQKPCKTRCQHKCSDKFSELTRHDMHEFYWGLGNYERQRNWLLGCIKKVPIVRRKQEALSSRRQNSYKYFIPWNDEVTEICQQFLLKTLDISQMVIRYAEAHAVQKSVKSDQRGRHEPHNKTKHEDKLVVHEFIKKLPAVASHYCRNQNSRRYLPAELRNVSFLHRIFMRQLESEGNKMCVSLKVFRDIFNKDFNLGFHCPKKDKCKLCESRKDIDFEDTEASKAVFDSHMKDKEDSKIMFLKDQKQMLENPDTICSSFDLQKVLNTPHGDNLLLYYSRKYSYYNETVYESCTRNGYCFLWGEADGGRGCNEICTIIFKYLKIVDDRKFKNVMLYCDSCSGQNRNRAMLGMLHTFLSKSSKNIETIKIVFLLPGHTYMPVDSVHATIERFTKRKIIWAPSEWSTLITNARINPKPLTTIAMEYGDFQNWKKLGDEIFPSSCKCTDGDKLKISQIRQGYFEKGNSKVTIKYSFDEREVRLVQPKQIKRNADLTEPGKIYLQKLPVSVPKKKNLEELCKKNIIPLRYHAEYLSMKSKGTIRDELAETDEEDEEVSED